MIFNSKETTYDIHLTKKGKTLLAQGKFKPKYYNFLDDEINYNQDSNDIMLNVFNHNITNKSSMEHQKTIGSSNKIYQPSFDVKFSHGEIDSFKNNTIYLKDLSLDGSSSFSKILFSIEELNKYLNSNDKNFELTLYERETFLWGIVKTEYHELVFEKEKEYIKNDLYTETISLNEYKKVDNSAEHYFEIQVDEIYDYDKQGFLYEDYNLGNEVSNSLEELFEK